MGKEKWWILSVEKVKIISLNLSNTHYLPVTHTFFFPCQCKSCSVEEDSSSYQISLEMMLLSHAWLNTKDKIAFALLKKCFLGIIPRITVKSVRLNSDPRKTWNQAHFSTLLPPNMTTISPMSPRKSHPKDPGQSNRQTTQHLREGWRRKILKLVWMQILLPRPKCVHCSPEHAWPQTMIFFFIKAIAVISDQICNINV